jgi:ABC-type phosphate/phosphonate transport system substrate-binding protein
MEGVQFDAAKFNWLGSIAPTNETMVAWKTTGVKTIEDARKNELIAGAVGSSGVTLSLPIMLNDLAGAKFKMVMGYSGSGQIDIAMERGEVSARASSWSSLKTAKPDWIANKDINILVYTGPKPPDLSGVPAVDDVVKNPEDRKVVDVVMVGDKLGHPFATSPDVPPERVEALRKAFVEMEKDPAFLADAAKAKLDVNPVSVETLKTAVDDTLNAASAVKARARKYFQ